MSEATTAQIVFFGIFALAVISYVLAWRSKRKPIRTGASGILRVMCGLAALMAASYAVRGLDDFSNPNGPTWETAIGEVVLLAMTVGLTYVAVRHEGGSAETQERAPDDARSGQG